MFSAGLLGSPDTQWAAVRIHLCVIMITVIVMNMMMIKDYGHGDEHDDGRGHEGDYDNYL